MAPARCRLMSSAENESASSDEQIDAIYQGAIHCSCIPAMSEIYLFPPPCAFAVSERPEVSRLIRKQAENGSMADQPATWLGDAGR